MRFFRWASDRIEEDGIVAFVTNRGFLDKRNFDGFRKVVEQEFSDIYIVDLGGDVRENPKLSGTKHNVFGIQTGVAISFLVRRHKAQGCRIHYGSRPEYDTRKDKLSYLQTITLEQEAKVRIQPGPAYNWLNLTNNDFEDFPSVASKTTKTARSAAQEEAIFRSFSLGVVTNRDDWVYGRTPTEVAARVKYLVATYEQARKELAERQHIRSEAESDQLSDVAVDNSIKWTRAVKADLANNREYEFDESLTRKAVYRPFDKRFLYFADRLNEMQYLTDQYFGYDKVLQNLCITFTDPSSQKPFMALGVDTVPDLHLAGAAAGTQILPRYRYKANQRLDNITDWALTQFRTHYRDETITRDDIFAYVYGVLHDPVYRETYALNLKREFPRIPFYKRFNRWRDWGQTLLDLHVGYESVEPFALQRVDVPDTKARAAGIRPRAILKADPAHGIIVLDSETQLSGIPAATWTYRLGNRSAIEWVLDQHKEKTPKDPVIREKFNTYRFADHKERVIDLLRRVTTVSVKTMEIVDAMRAVARE